MLETEHQPPMAESIIRVLLAEDSPTARHHLADLINNTPGMQVVGEARDGEEALALAEELKPDVVSMDIRMPRMDGLTFLHKIMTQHPLPVVICSSLTDAGSETAIKALEYGALEIITKPKLGAKQFLEESKIRICDAVKAAAQARIRKLTTELTVPPPKLTADAILAKARPGSEAMLKTTDSVVVVGASTGGTEALTDFLQAMPLDAPGIVIVQHMPENFTRAFANRLDTICKISVKEAENNDTVLRGRALIAPGNRHTLLKRSGARYFVEIKDGPLVSRHRPSVDVLFRSAARYGGKNCIGVIMTGMGDDGAKGMLEMKEAGAFTIAQDEESCVVFGMPKKAIELNAVDRVASLKTIPHLVLNSLS